MIGQTPSRRTRHCKVSVWMDKETYDAVNDLAYKEDRSVSETIRRFIKKEIEGNK